MRKTNENVWGVIELTTTLGIFADKPSASTKMAIVNANLAHHLCRMTDELRVIYFARFGQDSGFAKMGLPHDGYEVVNCKGGVWKSALVKEIIQHYKVDIVYSGDDWFNASGLVKATKQTKTPFYFLSPIVSLPIQNEAHKIFKECKKVFVPNRSYQYIPNGIYLPYAVDWMIFKPVHQKMFDEFTFLWIGRNEPRKNLNATILAFEKIHKKYDCKLVIRSDWTMDYLKDIKDYILNQKLPILMDAMVDYSFEQLAHFYSSFHAYICSAKASEFEMEILEANACALPTLVTDWTFMNENVKNGETGFLIPTESHDVRPNGTIWGNISIDQLAKQMAWMLENQNKAGEMGIDGLFWIRENSWQTVAETLFDNIIEN